MSTGDPAVEWTPGAGWERLKRELPGMVPDLTAEDMRKADEIIERAGSTPVSEEPAHPEADCHLCGGPNIAWSAPSPLWNEVMRGGSINGEDLHDGIVCPVCFATLAETAGVADLWMFSAKRVHVELETVTPSGRVWDEVAWLWREPGEPCEEAYARGISEGRRQATEAAYACCRCGERHVWQWRDPADRTRGGSWASRDGHGYEPLLPLHVADRLREALVGPLDPAEQPEAPPPGAGYCVRCKEWDARPGQFPRCPNCGQPWSALMLADEPSEDDAHFAAMEERHQHEAERPEGSDRA